MARKANCSTGYLGNVQEDMKGKSSSSDPRVTAVSGHKHVQNGRDPSCSAQDFTTARSETTAGLCGSRTE